MLHRLLALLLLSALPVLAGEGWETDFTKASETAAKEGKYMLLDFTGSDWCGWCIKLDREVFSKDDFKTFAKDNLVPVMLDFPRRKKIEPELKKQNQSLAAKYRIRGYPTILVLSPEGDLVKKTGYQPGGAAAYVTHLKSIIDPHKAKTAATEKPAAKPEESATP